jgi:hypothetical protein
MLQDKDGMKKVLAFIIDHQNLLDNLSTLNMKFPVGKGVFFWDDLARYDGWIIQQNKISNHIRITDDKGIRRGWGSAGEMEEFFMQIANGLDD